MTIVQLVITQGFVATLAGVAIGGAAAAITMRLLEGVLFGVTPLDPMTYFSITILVCVVGFLAMLRPVRRATNMDPNLLLRTD